MFLSLQQLRRVVEPNQDSVLYVRHFFSLQGYNGGPTGIELDS